MLDVNQKESVWKTEGLTEVAFDQATRKLSFQTIKSYPTAIIQVSNTWICGHVCLSLKRINCFGRQEEYHM